LQGYDAIRSILDYDPWTLEVVMAKMEEADDGTNTSRDDDTDLYGVNLGYVFDSYDAEMEGYVFYKRDADYDLVTYYDNTSSRTFEENTVTTFGLRGSVKPNENLSLKGEIAGQVGEIYDSETVDPAATFDGKRDREAMLANVGGEYSFEGVRFAPTIGLEYLYVSGEEVGTGSSIDAENTDDSDFEAWDPMYRGKVLGTIRDCLESLYETNDVADTSGYTNQNTIKASGSLDLGELVDGLSVDMAYLYYWFDEPPAYGESEDDLGSELNLTVTYDYTEDVQFLLDGALFIPGDYYDTLHRNRVMTNGGMTVGSTNEADLVANDRAVSILGSCKVTF
jgi:hypothetical protein